MLTFKELLAEEPSFRCYHALVASMAHKSEMPISVIRADGNKYSVFIIACKSQDNGKITARKVQIPKVDGCFFTSWLTAEFGDVPFSRIEA